MGRHAPRTGCASKTLVPRPTSRRSAAFDGADLELAEGDFFVDPRVLRKAEHTLAEDVQHHLVGAAGDLAGPRVQQRQARELARASLALPSDPGRSDQARSQLAL